MKRLPPTNYNVRQLQADVEAFDRMCATRPKKPPPMRLLPPTVSAAQLALRAERRAGVLT